MSWAFEAGHRIRLDLAGSDWPNAWSPPEPVTLTIERATATLELPVLDGPGPVAERPLVPPPNRVLANASPKELPKDDPEKGWVVWEVAHHQLRHETVASAGSMGDYDADPGSGTPSFRELYGGEVAVSTDDPGIASVTSRGPSTCGSPRRRVPHGWTSR